MVKSTSLKSPIFSIRKVKNQRKWKREEDAKLLCLAEEFKAKNWKTIAANLTNKNYLQCFSRYRRIMPSIRKGSWKKEEDAMIIDLVNKFGKSWAKISKIIKTRNSKQIRDRYLNVLDPEVNKNKFNEEEDQWILKLYKANGPKWGIIATFFHYRTPDMIKNRFYSALKKKVFDSNSNGSEMTHNQTNKQNKECTLIISSNGSEENNNNCQCQKSKMIMIMRNQKEDAMMMAPNQSNSNSNNQNLNQHNFHNLTISEDKSETKDCSCLFETDFFIRGGNQSSTEHNNWNHLNSMNDEDKSQEE